MSDEELQAILDSFPKFTDALHMLADSEVQQFVDGLLTEQQVITLAAGRKVAPDELPNPR